MEELDSVDKIKIKSLTKNQAFIYFDRLEIEPSLWDQRVLVGAGFPELLVDAVSRKDQVAP